MEAWYMLFSALLLFFGWWAVLGLFYWFVLRRLLPGLKDITPKQRKDLLKTRRQRELER